MSYATQADMVQAFGEREVISLTDRAVLGVIDVAVLNEALTLASSRIDSYLGELFGKPLPLVPLEIVEACCDIARYRLCGAATITTDETRIRYKDAIHLLEQVRDGKMNVGLTALGAAPAQVGSGVRYASAGRVFNSSALGDY